MTRRALEVRVGVTVVIASAILILGIMWFQKFKLTEKRYRFFVRFPEVGGLTPDDPINVNGVESGRVESVSLRERDVIVEMGISEGVRVPTDSWIALRSVGIMGERFVAIRSGTAKTTIQPGDTLMGNIDAGMSEVMGDAGDVLSELTETIRELRKVLAAVTEDEQLQASMKNLQVFSENLREVTVESQPRLTKAVRNFERVSTVLDSLFTKRSAALDSSLESVSKAGQRISAAVDNMTEASEALKEITQKLRSGEGTLGKLLIDEAFLEKLEKTVADLDDLIIDIKQHPGRYLSIHLF